MKAGRLVWILALLLLCPDCGSGNGGSNDGGNGDDGGKQPPVGCGSKDVNIAGSGCSYTAEQCTDDNNYKVDCPDNSTATYDCNCEKNGAVEKTFPTQDFCDLGSGNAMLAIANQECGWEIQ